MASLNSNGDVVIPQSEQNDLHFLIINATCYFVTKKKMTDVDKKAVDLSSELLGLIERRRRT